MGIWYDGYWYDVDTQEEAEQLHEERGVTIATDRDEVEAAITDGEYSPPDQRLLEERPTRSSLARTESHEVAFSRRRHVSGHIPRSRSLIRRRAKLAALCGFTGVWCHPRGSSRNG